MEKIVILTGAGISAESGLSTFRDADGLWAKHAIEDVATPEAFASNPDLVQRFKNGWPLAEPADVSDWYSPNGKTGYTSFPSFQSAN